MKLIVDVMGFENELKEATIACETFLAKHHDVKIILVGDEQAIKKEINKSKFYSSFSIVNAENFISQNDTVLTARRKTNTSMEISCNLLKDKKGDGFLSAGNTSVFVYLTYSIIGLMPGIDKIGLMPSIPSIENGLLNMIDVGASLDVNARDLYKYALIANVYAKQRVANPRIGILNIGTESHKGHALQREVNELLMQNKKINYIGFVESNNILNNVADVIVTDGFSGNIALKACEGSIKTFSKIIKQEYKKPQNLFAALLSKKLFKNIAKKFDYKNHAGAFAMGLNQICVKTHGSAERKQFYSALEMLYSCVKNKIIEKIKTEIKEHVK